MAEAVQQGTENLEGLRSEDLLQGIERGRQMEAALNTRVQNALKRLIGPNRDRDGNWQLISVTASRDGKGVVVKAYPYQYGPDVNGSTGSDLVQLLEGCAQIEEFEGGFASSMVEFKLSLSVLDGVKSETVLEATDEGVNGPEGRDVAALAEVVAEVAAKQMADVAAIAEADGRAAASGFRARLTAQDSTSKYALRGSMGGADPADVDDALREING